MDYTYTSIFRYMSCVGDSLSSGEFETPKEGGGMNYTDRFEYSWGQFIARRAGIHVNNFSRGGMTAREYLDSFADSMGFFDPKYKSQAYVIALGVNDLLGQRRKPGTLSDIDIKDYNNNNRTFIGDYARIIQIYKKISPEAKFFLVTMPREYTDDERVRMAKEIHRQLLIGLTKILPDCYVLDLFGKCAEYDEEYRKKFFLHGHLSPIGYIETAAQLDKMIHNTVASRPGDFALVGMSDLIK